MIDGWNFCSCVAQDIKKFVGEEIYKQFGQEIIDYLMSKCSEDFDIVRYPDDEEVIKAIKYITNT